MRTADAVSSTPFFIVGAGRSGTTLLRLMLTSHSRLVVPPETWFLLPLVKRLSIDRRLSEDEVECAVSIMTNHYRWPDMRLDVQEFRSALAQIRRPCLRDVVEIVYRKYMEAEGKVRWGDKTPPYIEIVPQLATMFCGSRFIHVVRDGRDVSKSLQTQGWCGPWLHDNAREWIKVADYERRWTGSELRERILRVRYEDLVVDTEATLRNVCRFIGEEFEPQMLSWQGKVDQGVPARELRVHGKLRESPNPIHLGRWKREMTAGEIFVSEAFMGAHLRRMRYQLRHQSPLWVPAFACTRLYCRIVLPAVAFLRKVVRFLRKRVAQGRAGRANV